MRTFMFFTFLFFSASMVIAQNLYVIKVEGIVFVDEKELNTGEKLSNETVIQFTKKTDRLYLLSPNHGYFLLSPEARENNQKDWIIAVKNALIPKNKFYKTATRSVSNSTEKFDDIYDLMGFFRDRVLLVEQTKFHFNAEKIKLDEKNKFEFINPEGKTIQYTTEGETFSLNGDFTDADFVMNYNQNGEVKKIGTFNLKIVKRENMAKELAVFFENRNNATHKYFENVVPYINDAYGNTKMDVINSIIVNDLKIPINVRNH